jgi:hypothetical protein
MLKKFQHDMDINKIPILITDYGSISPLDTQLALLVRFIRSKASFVKISDYTPACGRQGL